LTIDCEEWDDRDFNADDDYLINDFINNPTNFIDWSRTEIKLER
jgi:hypothetical protein